MARNTPKSLTYFAASSVLLFAMVPVMSLAQTTIPAAAKVAPLTLPPIVEQKLPNGLAVVTVVKRDLPLVAVRLVVPTGVARDPKGKEGLASFTSSLLRRGTSKRTADEIDDEIEFVGGLLGVDSGYESTSLGVTVPAEHVETALSIIADLAQRAAFPKKEFDVAKRREISQLKQDLDDPSSVADRAVVKFFYGKDHPYGHPSQGTAASVKTFKRDDLAGFYKDTFTPHGAMLLFVGDIDPVQAQELAGKLFGGWKGKPAKALQVAPPAAPQGLEILLVDKPDATQAQVRAITPGIARKDPAFFATTTANTVVGGGFTSRLVDEVRVNKGLSYSVSTRVIALREFGAISYSTFTKTETVREILDVSFRVLDLFRDKGPTQLELDNAKRYVIGLYPSRVESIDQLGEALASARIAGLPFESISEYRGLVAAVSVSDAIAAAKRYPGVGSAKIVIVGSAAKIRPQLAGLGKLTEAKASDYE